MLGVHLDIPCTNIIGLTRLLEVSQHILRVLNESYRVWYGKCSKISNFSLFVLELLSGLEFTKHLSELQTGKTQIRLLLKKQSDLGLPRPYWQVTSVRIF